MTADNNVTTAEKVSKVWGMARHGLEVGDGADSSQYATCISKSYTSALPSAARKVQRCVLTSVFVFYFGGGRGAFLFVARVATIHWNLEDVLKVAIVPPQI